MFTRILGKSGITVSALGLGCMEIGGKMKRHENIPLGSIATEQLPIFSLGDVDDTQSIRTIHFALDSGINFFDTAPAYGAGHSERILGRVLAGKRDRVVIATKFGKPIDEADNWYGGYAGEKELIGNIRKECENSLQRLGTDYLDLYQYHQRDFTLIEYAEETVGILESLVSEGKIRFYGWSTDDPDCTRVFARGAHCTAIQHNLNVVKDAPEQLALCDELDQASIARGALGIGFLAGRYTADNYRSLLSTDDYRLGSAGYFVSLTSQLDAVREILTSGGRTVAQGALAWVWARSERTIPIPGFRTLAQVEENIKALEFGPLTTEQMAQIENALGRLPA